MEQRDVPKRTVAHKRQRFVVRFFDVDWNELPVLRAENCTAAEVLAHLINWSGAHCHRDQQMAAKFADYSQVPYFGVEVQRG